MLRVIKRNLDVYFMVIACLDFALVGACAKILSKELPSIEIMFFRNIIGVFFMLYIISKLKIHKEEGHFWLLVFRGIVGTLSLYLFFYNVSNISLGGAFVFQKTSPIFIILIAFFVFKENIGLKGIFAILIAFVGVLLVSQPWASTINHTGFDLKNSSLGVLSGFFAALALTSVRQLRKFYPTEKIAFSFILMGAIMPAISMLVGEFYAPKELDFIIAPFIMPSLKAWVFIIIMGVLGTIYQIHITKAYGVAKKAGIVAGVSYLDVVFSLIIGLFLGDDLPSFMVFMGIIGIIFGGLILVKRK
ncbi:DMT family transporter [Campylobacter sp. MIT 97-5078]|uniref:DMT family transporter n=1 Tax=Campylobacter sp. MIT 97-5078 TaxID=1548153 RepID=UPI0005143F8E|nr:DMT family transporter [Campylobacter sp. MIT 97-5078]KGI55799.1 membrane protein [Campylobacter sp. MIT 97-5078]KGI57638.1 membrane protein [Campylobacter sp. MIT 97-5078]TQR26898.1 EamA family transporter [Campylobacter sp. MIT 97-5078]